MSAIFMNNSMKGQFCIKNLPKQNNVSFGKSSTPETVNATKKLAKSVFEMVVLATDRGANYTNNYHNDTKTVLGIFANFLEKRGTENLAGEINRGKAKNLSNYVNKVIHHATGLGRKHSNAWSADTNKILHGFRNFLEEKGAVDLSKELKSARFSVGKLGKTEFNLDLIA